VILACRSEEKTAPVVEEIRKETGNDQVEFMALDIGSLQSVKEFASAFRAKGLPLHILLNNAAVMACPYSLTEDGIEMQFGTNHIGHFYLTSLLFDLLDQAQPARIVTVSSMAHKWWSPAEGIHFETINDEAGYAWTKSYGQSKLANILFTRELSRRTAGRKIFPNTLHPGGVNTDVNRHLFGRLPGWLNSIVTPLSGLWLYSAAQGALTQLYLATSPEVEETDTRGQFYVPIAKKSSPLAAALDDVLALKLWDFSVSLLKEKVPDFEVPESLRS